MIYPPLDLMATGIVLGLFLIATHLGGLIGADGLCTALRRFPRSRSWGLALFALAVLWTLLLVTWMDLGEYSPYRRFAQLSVVVLGVLMAVYVPEFLAVRALGMLALLAAEPLIEAAFLKPQPARLLLVIPAYAWVVAGLFWVGMPYLLRDQIDWLTRTPFRWRAACLAGLGWGVALLICSLTLLRSA